MKSNMSWVNSASCGVVRKNHLNPRLVNLGEVASPFYPRDLKTLGHLATCGRNAAVVRPIERIHFLLGNHSFRFTLANIRFALMIGDDDAYLGATEVRQALSRPQGHVQIDVLVDDLNRGLYRGDGIDANLGVWPAQRIDHTDDDLFCLCNALTEWYQACRQDGGHEQQSATIHCIPPPHGNGEYATHRVCSGPPLTASRPTPLMYPRPQ